jgi:hypothetical protein
MSKLQTEVKTSAATTAIVVVRGALRVKDVTASG